MKYAPLGYPANDPEHQPCLPGRDVVEEDRNGRQDPDVRSAPESGLVGFLGARQFPDEEEDGGPGTSTGQGAP